MMNFQYLFTLSLLLATTAQAVKDREIFVKKEEKFNFCCELTPGENQAIILHQGSRRLRSLAHVLRYKQIDAESRAFFAEHPGYSMKDVSVEVESLCIEKQSPGAAIEDNNMNFTCELVEDLGLGSVLETETITIRVYETPIVESLPLELTSVVGGPASVKCTARGRPNLQIRWRNKDTQEIYATEKFEMLDDGKAELSLTLTGMKEEQDGQKLVCEATTSYPPNQPPAHQVTTLSVKCGRVKLFNKARTRRTKEVRNGMTCLVWK
uniref:Ig-like domain-containing protein n=1 Tax=Mesocestoides corti TaxID=53468 RepID=A0A5K3FCY0_MESCO